MAEGINVTARPAAAAAVEAVKVPIAAEQAAPAPKTEQPAADPKLQALAKKEQWIRKMQKEVESERSKVQSRMAEFEAKEKDYSTNYIPRNRLTEDPLTVLTEAGISYDRLTEMLLNSPTANDPTIKALLNKVRGLEDAQKQNEQRAQDAVTAQYNQALGQIRLEVKSLVSNNAEYETIKSAGMEEAVTELIEQTFNAEGYLMDIDAAAKEVENHLVEEGYKMSQLSKIKARLFPPTPKTEEPVSSSRPQSQAMKTLTNSVATQPSKRSTEKERIARAIAAFNGQKL